MDISWKKFLHYFRFWFLLILLLIPAVLLVRLWKGDDQRERTNTACVTEERVFDYGDVLQPEEEEALRSLIARREAETGCDIVLVTLNESLEPYARKHMGQTGMPLPSSYTMIYADNFYDEHLFGYNKPQGDGVILVDNWFREADGRVYSWLSTCGKAEDRFSSGMIDSLLDRALRDVDSDPAGAYEKYVNLFAEKMSDKGLAGRIPVYAPILAAAVATGLYIAVNLSANKGEKTVNARTYVTDNEPRMRRREDIFLRKSVTRRHIERSGGSGGGGGGGHHISGGGVSHGGGGHSR